MCYTVPLAATAITAFVWKKRNKDPKIGKLNLMFFGAATFGVIDHIWNGELFLISGNVAKDLLLGFVITAAIFGGWFVHSRQTDVRNIKVNA